LLEEELLNAHRRVPIDLKLRYLELKCQFSPDLVSYVIQRYKFPLDETLEICVKNENHFGAAYIRSRLGMRDQALKDYLKVTC